MGQERLNQKEQWQHKSYLVGTLIGVKTMEYVKGVDNRSQKKKEKAEKENKVEKEAIDKYRAAE